MNIWTLDFESYFGDDYTLKQMTTEEYIRDPRFQALMLGVRAPDGMKFWVPHEKIAAFLAAVDWSQNAILAHHSHFDGLILSYHYGVRPRFWFDTLSMARLVHGNHLSVALGSLAAHYGLEAKNVPYQLFKGRRWENVDNETRKVLGDGCLHDCELTWEIFQKLAAAFPEEELQVIDLTIRMFTEPQFVGDAPLFDEIVQAEQARKAAILQQVGADEGDLQSADKFVALLENLGIEVETKSGKKGPIPAIAKTDDFMKDLLANDDEVIATLAQARLDIKSTLSETRSARLADMARRGPMCVYLAPYAAHTLRWGGGDALNWQNFPRNKFDDDGHIVDPRQMRLGVRAPDGYLIAVVDKSQVECRTLCRVAGQHDDLEAFRNKRDLYSEEASKFYGFEVTKKHKLHRGFGKLLILSCGYQSGGGTIQKTAKRGTYGPPIFLTDEEAEQAKRTYRNGHQPIVNLWAEGNEVLRIIASGGKMIWRDVVEIKDGKIYGPNGSYMTYHLEYDIEERQWKRKTRRGLVKMYGGKLVENLIQFLCRIDMSQSLLRVWRETGLRAACTIHDEGAWVIPDDNNVTATMAYLEAEMSRCPTWLPGTPLAAEGVVDVRYVK
jgi:DNA polymerase